MDRTLLAVTALGLIIGAGAAQAGAPCHGSSCYKLVTTPPVYGTVKETYQVRPSGSQAQVIPAEYDYVNETVMVHPARKIARTVRARYETVTEKVMVRPAGKRWEVTRDAHGRTVGCWVETPAKYGYVSRRVEVEPASVVYEHVPAVYAQHQRKIMVRPTQVVHHHIPAAYETRKRSVLISPGGQHWSRY